MDTSKADQKVGPGEVAITMLLSVGSGALTGVLATFLGSFLFWNVLVGPRYGAGKNFIDLIILTSGWGDGLFYGLPLIGGGLVGLFSGGMAHLFTKNRSSILRSTGIIVAVLAVLYSLVMNWTCGSNPC